MIGATSQEGAHVSPQSGNSGYKQNKHYRRKGDPAANHDPTEEMQRVQNMVRRRRVFCLRVCSTRLCLDVENVAPTAWGEALGVNGVGVGGFRSDALFAPTHAQASDTFDG